MSQVTIAAMSGSLRAGSFNSALLRAAIELAPSDVRFDTLSFRGVPVYDGDLEATEGIPAQVTQLKNAVAQCDGLLIATPEYNNGMPGPLKNAIDWMSRPPADIDRVFRGRPLGLMGATPGQGGTRLSQQSWLQPFRTLGLQLWTGQQLFVAGAGPLFDADGRLTDERTRTRVAKFVAEFVAYVRNQSPATP